MALYLKGIEEELTVHPDLPPEPREGVGQAHKHDVMHSEDQHQDQRGFGELSARECKGFLLINLECLSIETAC